MGDETLLERILNGDEEPKDLPLALLQSITNDFSPERKIGQGGFGAVYKGELQNGIIVAVKRIEINQITIDDVSFRRECNSLMNTNHRNVVRFLGFCSNTHVIPLKSDGEIMFVNVERLLCFEYICNGSLDKHITDELRGLEWETRYDIITGICKGLCHLKEKNIIPLDLKPANILLDDQMVPKITDFGSSRGYLAPEYDNAGKPSVKSDIYSLGAIIIELVTGSVGVPDKNNVLRRWRHRWSKPLTLLQYQQVTRCIDIAVRCMQQEPGHRPSVSEIISTLTESESTDGQSDQAGSSPHPISLQHLKDITDNFSEDRILGSGGFGVVYKGVLHGEIVAVKKLKVSTLPSHKQFQNEIDLLMKLEHPNIVRLVGYCYDTQEALMPFEGEMVVAHRIEWLLCLECMPNGSLDKYISDVSSGLDWHKRCKIIEGISFGLQYLHEEANDRIIHLDLKPANILLGENWVPKITDFGLSRLLDKKTMHTTAASGTLGYMAPEYHQRGIITPMADIFSLGVIILEVITGHRDYPYDIRTHSEEFIELELKKWRNRLHKEVYTSPEIHCQQIERYIQIGLICVNTEREKRPTMNKIIDMLQGLESMDWYIRNEEASLLIEMANLPDLQAEQQRYHDEFPRLDSPMRPYTDFPFIGNMGDEQQDISMYPDGIINEQDLQDMLLNPTASDETGASNPTGSRTPYPEHLLDSMLEPGRTDIINSIGQDMGSMGAAPWTQQQQPTAPAELLDMQQGTAPRRIRLAYAVETTKSGMPGLLAPHLESGDKAESCCSTASWSSNHEEEDHVNDAASQAMAGDVMHIQGRGLNIPPTEALVSSVEVADKLQHLSFNDNSILEQQHAHDERQDADNILSCKPPPGAGLKQRLKQEDSGRNRHEEVVVHESDCVLRQESPSETKRWSSGSAVQSLWLALLVMAPLLLVLVGVWRSLN